MRLVSHHKSHQEKRKVQYTVLNIVMKKKVKHLKKKDLFNIFFICCEGTRGLCCPGSEADRELIGERLARNQWLSADQCNEGPLNITPGLSPPISSKTM